MAGEQGLVPGLGFVEETDSYQNLVPGIGFLEETVAAAVAKLPQSIYVKQAVNRAGTY